MIHDATFKNFKALRDVSLQFSPLTLIVGPNASGKTSILQAIHYLTRLGTTPPQAAHIDNRTIEAFRSKDAVGTPAESNMVLRFTGEWDGIAGGLQLIVGSQPNPRDRFILYGRWAGHRVRLEPEGEKIEGQTKWWYENSHPLLRAIASGVLLYLDPKAISRPSYSEELTLHVRSDGSNVAAVLADLAVSDPAVYQELRESIRSVVPSLRQLRLERATVVDDEFEPTQVGADTYRKITKKAVGYRIVLDFMSCGNLAANWASEGTLLTLGLLTILSVPSRPRLVLIDEFERGLHPKALGELVRQIRDVQRRFTNLQVIGTTHSPYLVDHFDAGEVIITALRDDGSVAAARLNEHPDFERWKDEMRPGEFWSTVGEDWLREKKEPGGE